jgi:hypothetical protein
MAVGTVEAGDRALHRSLILTMCLQKRRSVPRSALVLYSGGRVGLRHGFVKVLLFGHFVVYHLLLLYPEYASIKLGPQRI